MDQHTTYTGHRASGSGYARAASISSTDEQRVRAWCAAEGQARMMTHRNGAVVRIDLFSPITSSNKTRGGWTVYATQA